MAGRLGPQVVEVHEAEHGRGAQRPPRLFEHLAPQRLLQRLIWLAMAAGHDMGAVAIAEDEQCAVRVVEDEATDRYDVGERRRLNGEIGADTQWQRMRHTAPDRRLLR